MISNPLRLLVVDDHALFRRGLVGLLEDMPEFKVVGEAGDGQEALRLITETHPDIVLMDLNMPRMDGIEALRLLRGKENSPKILMLTISQDSDDLMSAIKVGADGYLLKNTEPEDLRKALIRLSRGQGILSPEVTAPVLKALARSNHPEGTTLLSDREGEILNLLANGQTTQQISTKLFISENTVKTHIRHILEKLGASNRTEAVSKAIQLGLVTPHVENKS